MAVVPSLGEILSVKGDAALGVNDSGINTTQIAADSSLPYIQAAATANAAADKYVYEQHQRTLENKLKSLDEIDTKGVLNNDFKDITSEYGNLLKNYYQNFDVLMNPQKNLDKAVELKQAEANLLSKVQQSKAQKLVLDEKQDYLAKHPNWATEANKQKIQQFITSPTSERQLFDFDAPSTVDFSALAKTAEAVSKVTDADSKLVQNGNFIQTSTGSHVDSNKFDEAALSAYNGPGEFGSSIREDINKTFNLLPDAEKQKYSDPQDFYLKNIRAFKGLPQTTQVKLDENQFKIQANQQAFQAGENAKNRALQLQELELKKQELGVGKGALPPLAAGAYKVQLMTNALTTGQVPVDVLQSIYGNDEKIKKTSYPLVPTTETDDKGVKHTVMAPDKDQGKIEQEVPKTSVISSKFDRDKNEFVVYVRDNATGRQLPAIRKSAAQIDSDFNNVLGPTKAAILADGSRRYLKDKTGTENYNLEKAQELFNFTKPKSVSSAQADYEQVKSATYNGKKINVGIRGNKYFDTATGKEIK